jgi:hypothetical protein
MNFNSEKSIAKNEIAQMLVPHNHTVTVALQRLSKL